MKTGVFTRTALVAFMLGTSIGTIGAKTWNVPADGDLQTVIDKAGWLDYINITQDVYCTTATVTIYKSGLTIEGNWHALYLNNTDRTGMIISQNFNTLQHFAIVGTGSIYTMLYFYPVQGGTPHDNIIQYCYFYGNTSGTTGQQVGDFYNRNNYYYMSSFDRALCGLSASDPLNLQITSCLFLNNWQGLYTAHYDKSRNADAHVNSTNFRIGHDYSSIHECILTNSARADGNAMNLYVSSCGFADTGDASSYPIRMAGNYPQSLNLSSNSFYFCPATSHKAWFKTASGTVTGYLNNNFYNNCVAGDH